MSKTEKPRLLSGMQPSGAALHLGNLEGALRNWVSLQKEYDMFCFIADWHSLTTMYEDPSKIKEQSLEIIKDFLAAGLDPDRSTIFIQSNVKEHAELFLLFSMITPLGWLERVPTYKEKQQNMQAEREPYGLLGYPVLQAADILLYKPYGVPVGKDQVPHLELSREIGRRYNRLYGPVFPEFQNILSEVPTLLGTDGRKMSKSYNNGIYIIDTEEETEKKIRAAYTDPKKLRKNDPGHPEGCSVYHLHSVYNKENKNTVETECRAGERGCVDCKNECIACVNENLRKIREQRKIIDLQTIHSAIHLGAEKAREVASQTIKEVQKGMSLF